MNLDVVGLREKFSENHRKYITSDGITLFLRAWEPIDVPKKETAILILHGITAHSGPYEFIGLPLSKLGFSTFGLDLRGHGLSDGTRGDTPGVERLVQDLCEVVSFLNENYSTIVLMGHSLGVFQSALIIKSCLQNISGVVLLSGARTMKPGVVASPSATQKIKILLNSLLFPCKPVVEYRREGMVGLDDPLFTFKYTLRFIRMIDMDSMTFPGDFNLPVFVGVGEEDELFSVESVRELYEEIPSSEKEFYIEPGARHAVFPVHECNSWSGIGMLLLRSTY
ncbi:MAG: alpha/beta hydrolase [Candidatus Thorarchaeota archaeon]|jgi:alpha-beta hydrolase superfamily lysophospholipase